ncbi:MAG: hypothetical protein OXM58_11785 [Rhodospirillaceae bacterium]|nr:hypothetical protein [Rhodospirillaceae bacterium]MDE0619316.1 hypothetical protein [Rhodospirillaceae bacterium]
MDTKHRAVGASISAGWLAIFGRELITLDPQRTIDVLGDIVSPASLFLGLVVIGCGGLVYYGWPVVYWAGTYGRRKAKRQEVRNREMEEKANKERKRQIEAEQRSKDRAVNTLELLQGLCNSILKNRQRRSIGPVSKEIEHETTAKVLIKKLLEAGIITPEFSTESYYLLHVRVSKLIPYVRMYGIERGKKQIPEILKDEEYDDE